MNKKISFAVAVLLCFLPALSASAYEFTPVERTLPLVVDNADLISSDVEAALLEKCSEITAEYELEVAIVTTPDLGGLTAEQYADDFYDYNGYGYGENDDGILVVYKSGAEGDRKIHITSHGKGVSEFSDAALNGIIDEMKSYLIAEDFDGAFIRYLEMVEDELKPGVKLTWLFGLMIAGAVVGFIVMSAVISKNKSVTMQRNARVYTRQNSMTVTGARDMFAYSRVTATPKVQNNNSGGGSTHRSSSGRSHGGSGASF